MEPSSLAIPPWQLLTVIGVILIVAEIAVPGFIMLPIGLGFLLTAGVAAFTSSWIVLLACLAAFEIAIYFLFSKQLRRFHSRTKAYTNAEGMVGNECIVSEAIPKGGHGYVKLYGDTWQARTESGSPMEVGTRAIITRIDGNKVCVEPIV